MVYRFTDCELDEHLYQLRRDGAPVPVEPKVFDVLAYLIQHRDRVVGKGFAAKILRQLVQVGLSSEPI